MAVYKVQNHAAAAVTTFGATKGSQVVQALSSLGNGGACAQNAERDLHRYTSRAVSIKPYYIRLPVKVRVRRKNKGVTTSLHTAWEWIPVIHPWDIMRLLWTSQNFRAFLHPDDSVAKDYWEDFLQQEYSEPHSVHETSKTHPLSHTVAIHIHIDGTKIFRGLGDASENIVYSFSGALARGKHSKFWFAQLPLWLMGKDTNAFLVFYSRWVFKILRRGRMPRIGYYGEVLIPPTETSDEILPGYIALLAGVKADAKEKKAQHLYALPS